jgi:hypothetical protein
VASVRDSKAFRRQLARQAKPAVTPVTEEIAARVSSNLASHHKSGRAQIKVEHGYINDYVILDDPASLSIEFGRGEYTRDDGVTIGAAEGLHVLSRAVHGV